MKAAIFEDFGSPLVVREIPTPKLGDREVLVKVATCGVCYSDVKVWKGLMGLVPGTPHVLGHEIAGTVAELGKNAVGVKVGDRVIVYMDDTCDQCIYCRAGRENECTKRGPLIGFARSGGYADFVQIRDVNAIKIPDNLNFDDAAPLADGALTPYHAIVDRAKVRLNQTAMLVGMGGLAMYGLQVLKLCGARVMAVSRSQSKLDMAAKFGAESVVNSKSQNVPAEAKKFGNGLGIDYVFDFVGNSETIRFDIDSARVGGQIFVVGYETGKVEVPVVRLLQTFASIEGTRAGTRKDLREILEFASRGMIKSTVSKSYSLDEANEALRLLASGEAEGRVILRV